MPPPPFTPEHAKRVADPALSSALQECLKGRVLEADVEDMVQAVLAELLPYRDPPETIEGLIALGIRILKNDVFDHYRHRETVRDVEVRPRDEALDETVADRAPADGWDEVDTKKRVKVVEHLVAQGKLTAGDVEVLERSETEGFRALAEELGTNENALRVKTHRKRALLEKHWVRYAAFGLPGLALILLMIEAAQPPPPVGAARPWTGTPDEPTPEEQAAALRANAEHACGAAQWQECLDKLDEARGLDPDGDNAPKVQALRAQAHAGIVPAPSSTPARSHAPAPSHASAPATAPSHAHAPTPSHAPAPAPAPVPAHGGPGP
jgi:DNA-directed RNA polymerase specialized sigma24 family protein